MILAERNQSGQHDVELRLPGDEGAKGGVPDVGHVRLRSDGDIQAWIGREVKVNSPSIRGMICDDSARRLRLCCRSRRKS
jgi:hypothetical protein